MDHAPSLDFSVRYRLGEYLSILNEHVVGTLLPREIDLKPPSRLQSFFYRMPLNVLGSVLFLYKSARVGTCRFAVDQAGIVRRSKQRELVVPWSEVTCAYRYQAGYLITKKEGSMPIPYRVLSPGQRTSLEALLAPHLATPAES